MIAGHLRKVFTDSVFMEYIDTSGPEMSEYSCVLSIILKENLQLPVVNVDQELFSSGGKINGPTLRMKIE